ncbi:MAG TPA: hypothetical protein VFH92_12430 [Phenylobacterium sp.]|nr:hypothetical protein [Phenylobacterium sp.]
MPCSFFKRVATAAAAILCLASAPAFAAGGGGAVERAEIAKGLKVTAVFGVLETYYPKTFEAAIDAVQQGVASGKSMRDIQAQIRTSYADLVKAQLPKAEGSYVLETLRITRRQAEAMAAAPPDCMAVLGFGPFRAMAQSVVPPELTKAELDWAANMLRQTATRPVARTVKPPSEETIRLLAFTAYDGVSSDAARQRLQKLGGAFKGVTDPDDQKAICEFSIQMFAAIEALPTDQAVDTFLGFSAQ